MNYIKVKDKDYLLRDIESNGIINSDDIGYQAYVENYKRTYCNGSEYNFSTKYKFRH